MWDKQVPEGIDKMVNYKGHMAEYRFNQMKTYMLYVFADEEEKGENAWWKIKAGIKGYNDNQKSTVRSSPIKVFDESVSAFCPQVSSKGNLPHLSMIARKPKLLGTKLKVTADSTTGIFLYLELQKGQLGMADSEYSNAMLKTSACCCQMAEGCESNMHNNNANKTTTYLGDSWFASIPTCVKLKQQFNVNFIGIIKTNHAWYQGLS